METLPLEVCLNILRFLDLKSRHRFSEVFQFVKPFLYDKSLIRNLKLHTNSISKDFEFFWRKFPTEKRNEIKSLDISYLRFNSKTYVAFNFISTLTTLEELRILSTNLSEDKQLQIIFNNEQLRIIWMSLSIIAWPSSSQLENLKALFVLCDNLMNSESTKAMFKCLGQNLEYIWIEYNDLIGNIYYGEDSFNVINSYCPKLQEIFTIFTKTMSNNFVPGNLKPYNIFYRNDGNTYYLFKNERQRSRILDQFRLFPHATGKYLNISHFETKHVVYNDFDLTKINFNELLGFSSNVCRYMECSNSKRSFEGDIKDSKFGNLITSLKTCEKFELIGCKYKSSIFDENPLNWNENVLSHLSKLTNLTVLTLYNVKFSNLQFLKAVSKSCPVKTLKITIGVSYTNLFYNIVSIVKEMPHLLNFRYEDVNGIVADLKTALIPIRHSRTLVRYALIMRGINSLEPRTTFSQLPFNKNVKLVSIRLVRFSTSQLKLITGYFNSCFQFVSDFKFIVGLSTESVYEFLKKMKIGVSLEEFNEVLTPCSTVIDFEHIYCV